MNWSLIAILFAIIVFIGNIFLGGLVLAKDAKDKGHQAFFAFAVALAFWASSSILVDEFIFPREVQMLFLRIDLVFGVIGAYMFFLFSLFIFRRIDHLKNWVLWVLGGLTGFFAVIAGYGNWVVKEAYFTNSQLSYIPGILDHIYALFIGILGFWAIYNFIEKYRTFEGGDKKRVGYLLAAVLVPGVTIITLVLVVNRLFDMHILPVEYTFIAITRRVAVATIFMYLFVTTFAIIKHQLFGIKILFKRLIFWLFVAVSLWVVFYLLAYVQLLVWGTPSLINNFLLSTFLAFMISILFSLYENHIQDVLNSLLRFVRYDRDEIVQDFLITLHSRDMELSERFELFTDVVRKLFETERIGLFTVNVNKDSASVVTYWSGFTDDEIIVLEQEDGVNTILKLIDGGSSVVAKIIRHDDEYGKILSQFSINLVISIKAGEYEGLILLSKRADSMYMTEDINLLTMLSGYLL